MMSAAGNPWVDTSPIMTPSRSPGIRKKLIEVARDGCGRFDARSHAPRVEGRGVGQELHLEVVGQLELTRHALPLESLPYEPVVLKRRPDLARDRREQLPVGRLEPATVTPADQVQDADRPRPPGRWSEADRNRQHGFGASREFIAPRGVRLVVPSPVREDERRALAEHAGRDSVGVVGGDRRLPPLGSHRGDEVQAGLRLVEHPERPAAGRHDLAHFGEDQPGRLLEREEGTERLGDGVEEVDLLMALGDLVGVVPDRLGVVPEPADRVADDGTGDARRPTGPTGNLEDEPGAGAGAGRNLDTAGVSSGAVWNGRVRNGTEGVEARVPTLIRRGPEPGLDREGCGKLVEDADDRLGDGGLASPAGAHARAPSDSAAASGR